MFEYLWSCLLILLFALIILYCVYGKRKQNRFKNTAVKYLRPPLPVFGNNIKMLSGLENMPAFITRLYNSFPDQKYIGAFDGLIPVIVLRDIELIKSLSVKDFDNFHDHRTLIDEDLNIFGKSLFSLKGDKWRDMRATLSPAFSSSKMRNMFVFIEQCAKNMSDFYLNELKKEGKSVIEIEAKEVFSKYTLDTIATSAFGIEGNSIRNENEIFHTLAKKTVNITKTQLLKFMILLTFPKLFRLLKLRIEDPEVPVFFMNLIKDTMKNRIEHNIYRPDMIQLLMQAREGSLVHTSTIKEDIGDIGFSIVEESSIGKQTTKRSWSDDYLAAQAFIFFIGGFGTTSDMLSFFFYEMSRDPSIQEKVQQEIDNFLIQTGGKLDYNNLSNLKYLDMCVSETLRIWPPIASTDRTSINSYKLPSPNEESNETFELKPNELIWIPIYALHHDPKYFPDPEKFDPERFSDENKINILPGSYIPFGVGPRNCIGSRYALMVMKAIIFHILSIFDIIVTENSEIPIKLANIPFNLKPNKGIWIGLRKRDISKK